jgi:filamentous hemagglutinin
LLLTPSASHAACTTTICVGNATACTISAASVVDDGCTLNFGTTNVTISRNGTLETASAGDSYSVVAGSLTVEGWVKGPGGTVAIATTGLVRTQSVSNSPGRIDVGNGGSLVIEAGGAIELLGPNVSADGGGGQPAGSITLAGSSVTATSSLQADGDPGAGGSIDILSAGAVDLDGLVSVEGVSNSAAASGGTVAIDAGGALSIDGNLVANGAHDGDGGTVRLAAAGTATIGAANVRANGVGGGGFANGGRILVSAPSVAVDGNWQANGNAGGYGGDIRVEGTSSSGTITVSSASEIAANGGGGGGVGGRVLVDGAGDVTVDGDVTATGADSDSVGGDLVVRAGDDLTIAGTLDARSTAGSSGVRNGTIYVGPACDVTISSTGKLKANGNAGSGTNTIQYYKTFSAGSGSELKADSASGGQGGNRVVCGCTDANDDGTCDADTCSSSPSWTGATVTPSATEERALPSSCS